MENNSSSNKSIYLLLVCAAVFWAGAFIAGKFSVAEMPVFSITFLRFFFATICIFPFMIYTDKNWRLKKKDLPVIILLGVVGMFGYHVLFFTALKYTTAINSSIIGSTNPIWVNILSLLFLGVSMQPRRILAIALSFTGVLLTITNGNLLMLFNSSFNSGDLIMLAAVLCWAVYNIISKKVMERYSPIVVTTYSFMVCALILLPFFIYDLSSGFIQHTTIKSWSSVIYMAIFPSVIGYLSMQTGVHRLGAGKASVFINLVPIFSAVMSVIFLGETLSTIKILSGALIILGVYINTKTSDIVKKTEPLAKQKL